jgi:hypothetical protein
MNYLPRVLAIVGQELRKIGNLDCLPTLKIKPIQKTGTEKNAAKIENNGLASVAWQQESPQNPVDKASNNKGKNPDIIAPVKRLGTTLAEGFKKIDQDMKKKRRELELNVTALNRLVFVLVLLGMLISNMSLWIYLNFAL